MEKTILLAYENGDEHLVEKIENKLKEKKFNVWSRDSLFIGESVTEEVSKLLDNGGPIVICATIRSLGTGFVKRIFNAAKVNPRSKIFILRIEKDAYINDITWGEEIGEFWLDPERTITDLCNAINKYYPTFHNTKEQDLLENKYNNTLLAICNTFELSNLPYRYQELCFTDFALDKLYIPLKFNLDDRAKDDFNINNTSSFQKKWFSSSNRHTFEKLIKNKKKNIILGEQGSGKTTLIRWIATACVQHTNKLSTIDYINFIDLFSGYTPIIIRGRDLKVFNKIDTLADLFNFTLQRMEFTQKESEIFSSVLINKLQLDKLILLIDGLDEIRDKEFRFEFHQKIDEISKIYKNLTIIATSRTTSYREFGYNLNSSFTTAKISNFDLYDIKLFISKWYNQFQLSKQGLSIDHLEDEIIDNKKIYRLAENPLLLTILLLIKLNNRKLPIKKSDIYWLMVDILFNWKAKLENDTMSIHEALPQLSYIAYHMCLANSDQFTEQSILSLLVKLRKLIDNDNIINKRTPQDFLEIIASKTGILLKSFNISSDFKQISVFEFRHSMIQEYLASVWILEFNYENSHSNVEEHLTELVNKQIELEILNYSQKKLSHLETWQEVIRLCFSSYSKNIDDIFYEIINFQLTTTTEIRSRVTASLCALCLAETSYASFQLASKIITLLILSINDRDGTGLLSSEIDKAASELATSPWSTIFRKSLVTEFCDTNAKFRKNVGRICVIISGLLVIDRKDAIEERLIVHTWQLKNAFEKKDDIYAVSSCFVIINLAYQGKAFLVKGLIDSLLQLLIMEGPTAHASSLALYWLQDSRFHSSVWTPTEGELNLILTTLKNHHLDYFTIHLLITILGNNRYANSVDYIIDMLKHENIDIQRASVTALGNIKNHLAIVPIVELIERGDRSIHREISRSLCQFNSSHMFELLTPYLNHFDRNIREIASYVLDQTEYVDDMELLTDKLIDPNPQVRMIAIKVISKSKKDSSIMPLLKTLDDSDEKVVSCAIYNLGQFGGVKLITKIENLLAFSELPLRLKLIKILGQIGDDYSLTILKTFLLDELQEIRTASVEAISMSSDKGTERTLVSKYFNNTPPFIDPLTPITKKRIYEAQLKLKLTKEDIVSIYAGISTKYHLTFADDPTYL
jgi:HEAT repeat protein/energy-coupling factor transporter ATP-binding protein EcfA2